MARSKPNKTALLSAMAAHVLQEGLNTASLRPLAAAAGTSDRMLIYHFGSKEGLITALLEYLAQQLAVGLDAMLPTEPFESEAALVGAIVGLMRSEMVAPYTRVWLDIVSGAAQGQGPHTAAGARIIDIYIDWIAARHPGGRAAAPSALAIVEGVLVLDAVGQRSVADAALKRLSG